MNGFFKWDITNISLPLDEVDLRVPSSVSQSYKWGLVRNLYDIARNIWTADTMKTELNKLEKYSSAMDTQSGLSSRTSMLE